MIKFARAGAPASDGVPRPGRSVHARRRRRDGHDGLHQLRLNAGFAVEAAKARFGQGYEALVCGHQLRAIFKLIQALMVPTTHAAEPRCGERMTRCTEWMSKT